MTRKFRAKLSTKQYRTRLNISEPVEIKATLGEDGQPTGPATFSGIGYSGGIIPGYTTTPRLQYDYVIDLSGTKNAKTIHANLDHKANQRVGHVSNAPNDGKQLLVEGVFSASTSYRDEVAGGARDGQPWELSIEGNLGGKVLVPKGETAVVNGRTFHGPFFRMTKNTFTDVAFVTHGADDGNSVKIAASAAGEGSMLTDLEKFAASLGVDLEAADESQKAALQEAFEAKAGKPKPRTNRHTFQQLADEELRDQDRQDEISRIGLEAIREPENYLAKAQIMSLVEHAIEAKLSVKDFELELLRGTKTKTGVIRTHQSRAESNPEMIECALCMNAGLPKIEEHFSADTLNAVDRAGMRNFGLQQFLLQVAAENGYRVRAGERIHNGNIRAVLEYCFPPMTARLTGFSTISVATIVGNVANKEALAGYMEEDQTWREIATVKSVSNFHTQTAYRMLDSLEYDELPPTGQIEHGTLGEETFTRRAKTYAKMLGITRTDIINDDLGAFDDLRARLGRGAAKKFNNIFWAAFINNTSFFTTARTNYIEGSTTNLGTDGVGLQQGITAFRKMLSPAADGSKRVGVGMSRPTILLVPPELEFVARRFWQSLNLQSGINTSMPDANIFAGLYRPVIQNRLSDSAFTGFLTTGWYLFGDEMKPMVVSFLNGQQTPTVESTDGDFNQLGIQFRAYHDWGADQAEYLAGVKVKGAT